MQLNGKVPQTPNAPKSKPYIQNKHHHHQEQPPRAHRATYPRPKSQKQPPRTPPRQRPNPLDKRFKRMRDYSPTPLRSRKNLLVNQLHESIANIFNRIGQEKLNQDRRHKGPKGTYVFKASRLGLFKPPDLRVKRKIKTILKARGDNSRGGGNKKVKFNPEVYVYDIESYKQYNASVVRELKRLKMQEMQSEGKIAADPPASLNNSIAFNKKNMQRRKQAEEIRGVNPGPMGRSSHRAAPSSGQRYSNRQGAQGMPQGAMTYQGRRDPHVRGGNSGTGHKDRNDFLFDSLPVDDPKLMEHRRNY